MTAVANVAAYCARNGVLRRPAFLLPYHRDRGDDHSMLVVVGAWAWSFSQRGNAVLSVPLHSGVIAEGDIVQFLGAVMVEKLFAAFRINLLEPNETVEQRSNAPGLLVGLFRSHIHKIVSIPGTVKNGGGWISGTTAAVYLPPRRDLQEDARTELGDGGGRIFGTTAAVYLPPRQVSQEDAGTEWSDGRRWFYGNGARPRVGDKHRSGSGRSRRSRRPRNHHQRSELQLAKIRLNLRVCNCRLLSSAGVTVEQHERIPAVSGTLRRLSAGQFATVNRGFSDVALCDNLGGV